MWRLTLANWALIQDSKSVGAPPDCTSAVAFGLRFGCATPLTAWRCFYTITTSYLFLQFRGPNSNLFISLRPARASELGYSAYISSVRPLQTDRSEKCCKWIFYTKTQHALHFYMKCRSLDIITVKQTTVPDSSRCESVPYIDFLFYRQFWCCVVLCGAVYSPVQMKGCNFRGVAFEIREVEVIW